MNPSETTVEGRELYRDNPDHVLNTLEQSSRQPQSGPSTYKRYWPSRFEKDSDLAFENAKDTGGGRIALTWAALGAEGIPYSAEKRIQPRDGTVCEKCHGLRFSCILGHEVTIDDMEYFHNLPASRFDLGYVGRQTRPCRMCSFMRDCLAIEQSNGNPSKPKLALLSASEFFGVKDKNESINVPCPVFAPKKVDRRGCILPAASSHREGTIIGRKIDPDKIDYGVISGWLSFCKERHTQLCHRRGDNRIRNLRVIDCVTRKLVPLPSEEAEFVTLSYVWGVCTALGNGDNSELPVSVPKVMEDAMVVTVKLGFRFLWVDRYCIPQDDDKEKQSQLKNIGRIYSFSALTIVAAAGEGPDHGLSGVSSTSRRPQPSVSWGSDQLVYCTARSVRQEIQSSKWNSGGWTYQEGLLARKRLIFTDREVYFQCQAMHQAESIATQLDSVQARNVVPLSVDFGVIFPKFQELRRSKESFQFRVHEFIRRDFTFDSDALDAFRGILALFEESNNPISHLCGIPLFSFTSFRKPNSVTPTQVLATALSWHFDCPMIRRPEFPSWSWAGWKPSLTKARESRASSCFHIRALQDGPRYPIPKLSRDCSIAATVEPGSRDRYDWDASTISGLEEHAFTGKPPQSLILTGWGFEVTVHRTEIPRIWFKPYQRGQSVTSWRFTEPENMSKERWKFEENVDIPERLLL